MIILMMFNTLNPLDLAIGENIKWKTTYSTKTEREDHEQEQYS